MLNNIEIFFCCIWPGNCIIHINRRGSSENYISPSGKCLTRRGNIMAKAKSRSNAASSWVRAAVANTKSRVTIKVSVLRESSSYGSWAVKKSNTTPTLHVRQYLGFGGLALNTPFMNRETGGRWPNVVKPTKSWFDSWLVNLYGSVL